MKRTVKFNKDYTKGKRECKFTSDEWIVITVTLALVVLSLAGIIVDVISRA